MVGYRNVGGRRGPIVVPLAHSGIPPCTPEVPGVYVLRGSELTRVTTRASGDFQFTPSRADAARQGCIQPNTYADLRPRVVCIAVLPVIMCLPAPLRDLAHLSSELGIPTQPLSIPMDVRALDGLSIGRVTHHTTSINLRVSGNHSENAISAN